MDLIKTYVITLKSKENFKKTECFKNLLKITNSIITSKGVILNKEQQNKYYLYPNSVIGIRLAHIKIWKKIKKNKDINKYTINDYTLILEDDTILNIDNEKYKNEIKNICDNNFDIYKLHSDFNIGCTSTAAYIINNKSINKILKEQRILFGHLDFDLFILNIFKKINVKTHPYNIFITDERDSLNRINKYNFSSLFKNVKITKRCDKSLADILNYKVIKIYDNDYIVIDIVLFVFLILSLVLKNKYLFLIIIILICI